MIANLPSLSWGHRLLLLIYISLQHLFHGIYIWALHWWLSILILHFLRSMQLLHLVCGWNMRSKNLLDLFLIQDISGKMTSWQRLKDENVLNHCHKQLSQHTMLSSVFSATSFNINIYRIYILVLFITMYNCYPFWFSFYTPLYSTWKDYLKANKLVILSFNVF
jgi:hypothetical protein